MGEKDADSVKPELEANGNAEMEEQTEFVMEKTEEQRDGVTEMEEEHKASKKVENNNMDKEKVNDIKETEGITKNEDIVEEEGKYERMEESKEEEEKQEVAEEKVDMEIEEMNHGPSEQTETDDKVDGVGEEKKPKESKEERGLKNRRTKSGDGKKERSVKQETEDKVSKTQREKKTKETETSMDKKEEKKTSVTFTIDRPVRERKSVERLVAIIEQDASMEFKVEKGPGTALKDIPNGAWNIRPKQENCEKFYATFNVMKHQANMEQAPQVKNNISRFSGFAWHDDEEKQTLKLKEKLDKIFREKLVEFCDVLDIPILSTIRKEDIISKLIEFLVAPHATTTELLAEQEKSSKGKKRKRENKSASGSSTPSEGSAKNRKKTKGASTKGNEPKLEDESEEEEETHDEDVKNNGSEKSEYEKSEPAEHEEKASEFKESDKDKRKKKQETAKSSAKKRTAKEVKTKKVTLSNEASLPPKKEPSKFPPSHRKNNKDTSTKNSGKKKDESTKEKISTPKKASSIVSPGEKILKVRDNLKEEKLKPSDDELRNAIDEILKEVDFNTATFTDILKLLAKRFNKDLVPRKPSIKLMIQDELTKIADAEEEKDGGGVVKDGKKPSTQHVNA